jgi:DNA processing protein
VPLRLVGSEMCIRDRGTAFGWLKRSRSWIVTSSSTLWPEGLTHLSWGSPALLWGRGCAASLTSNLRYLAIVGSRGATNYGNWVTSDLVEELKSRKLAIVSGGAYGIDAVAHRSALAVQLPTIAVMAGGVDRFYPSGNQDLLEQVLRQGAVVSELPPGSSPTKWRFLQRNRLIAALSDAVVVVEAGKRSGSISTVNHATVLGRPVGAIPGPVTATSSVGCNRLIQSAQAELIQDADDVLSLLGLSNTLDVFSEAQPAGLGPLEIRLLDALGNKPKDPQQLSKMAGLSPTEAHVAFTQLVLKGKAGQTDAGWLKVAK